MEKLNLIKNKQGVKDLIDYLRDKDYVAYDTETTGGPHTSEIIGISVCANRKEAFYVIISYWDKEQEKLVYLETKDEIPELLNTLKQKKLIMHNAIFDCIVTEKNYQVDLMPSLHTDTMVLAHLLDENESAALKEIASRMFGEDSTKEQQEMKESVLANGGKLTKEIYEMYKCDPDILGRYGAKDAILTLKIFQKFIPKLFDSGLNKFFYEDESMPLLKGPAYSMNKSGFKIDVKKLQELKETLEQDCAKLKEEVLFQITPYVKEKYPGTNKKNSFNLDSSQQMSWLLFVKLGNDFKNLTKKGKEIAKSFIGKVPYSPSEKKKFKEACKENNIVIEKYLQCDTDFLLGIASKYSWVAKLIDYKKQEKLLKTYVLGIEKRLKYGVIYPSFIQIGTTSGRFSSKEPNFQNLPRDDTRVKDCVIARPGKVFVGADYEQLEPRIFSSYAQEFMLLKNFENPNSDFYSTIGIPVFNKYDSVADKDAPNFFGKIYKPLRQISKMIALSVTYGTTPYKLAMQLKDESGTGMDIKQCNKIINDYFENYPGVKKLMLDTHEEVKDNGVVYNMFGRPRRIPEAKKIKRLYPNVPHSELPYQYRNPLNLSVNHKIQSTAASIVNRAMIAFYNKCQEKNIEAKIILQVHDEIVVECDESVANEVVTILKDSMENTVKLPGVSLAAEPKIGKSLKECK